MFFRCWAVIYPANTMNFQVRPHRLLRIFIVTKMNQMTQPSDKWFEMAVEVTEYLLVTETPPPPPNTESLRIDGYETLNNRAGNELTGVTDGSVITTQTSRLVHCIPTVSGPNLHPESTAWIAEIGCSQLGDNYNQEGQCPHLNDIYVSRLPRSIKHLSIMITTILWTEPFQMMWSKLTKCHV